MRSMRQNTCGGAGPLVLAYVHLSAGILVGEASVAGVGKMRGELYLSSWGAPPFVVDPAYTRRMVGLSGRPGTRSVTLTLTLTLSLSWKPSPSRGW